MESTGNCREVAISIITAPPSPLPPSVVKQRFITMFLLLYSMTLALLIEFLMVRIKYEEENQSLYKTHMMLMIISFVAYVMALISLSLMYTQKYLKSLRIFEIICGFSGIIAMLSLYFVMCLPEKLIWVGYLVLSLVFVIAGACYWFLPKEKNVEARIQHEKISINCSLMVAPLTIVVIFYSGISAMVSLYLMMCLPEEVRWVGYLFLSIVYVIAGACHWFLPKEKDVEARIQQEKISINYFAPLPILLVFHVPDGLSWIKLWVICGTIVIVAVYNAIRYIKSRNKKVHNVEACQVIQSNKPPAESSFE